MKVVNNPHLRQVFEPRVSTKIWFLFSLGLNWISLKAILLITKLSISGPKLLKVEALDLLPRSLS